MTFDYIVGEFLVPAPDISSSEYFYPTQQSGMLVFCFISLLISPLFCISICVENFMSDILILHVWSIHMNAYMYYGYIVTP